MTRQICFCIATATALGGCSALNKPTPKAIVTNARTGQAAGVTSFTITPAGQPTVTQLKVGTEAVTAADIWRSSIRLLGERAASLPPAEFRRFVAEKSAQLIIDKVSEMLLYQRATLRFTEQMEKTVERYVDQEIRQIVTSDYGGVQRRYERLLEKEGTSLDAVRQRLRREFVIASYLENEIKPKLNEPTRADLAAMYESGLEASRKPERRDMSLIDIRIIDHVPHDVTEPTREQSAAAKTASRAKVELALAELRGGADFAEVARKHSGGLHATEGGAWGWVTKGSVRERFEPAVDLLFTLAKGQVSDVIETPDGFFVVRCDDVEKDAELTFESAQPMLRERHAREQYNKKMGELVNELRAKATIEPANLDIYHQAVVEAALEMTPPPIGP